MTMSTSSIHPSSSYLDSILSTALQGAGSTAPQTSARLHGPGAVSGAPSLDNSQLSPLAQLLSTLQQLQQTDPVKYQQVTQQIATNLQTAAQTAQSNGNTTAANQLNQLATDFTSASTTGQLPNILDLAQASGGHHHHHHSHSHANAGGSSTASNNPPSDPLSQLRSNGQADEVHNDSLNPMAIIFDTLSSAGITLSNG
jgi:hypothetical protein